MDILNKFKDGLFKIINGGLWEQDKPIQSTIGRGGEPNDCVACGRTTYNQKYCADCLHNLAPKCVVCKTRPAATITQFKYCSVNCELLARQKKGFAERFFITGLKRRA